MFFSDVRIIAASTILLLGVIDDLRFQKVHNKLSFTCFAISLALSFYLGGWNSVLDGLLASIAAFLILTPLVAIQALGAGDMKLMVAIGPILTWAAMTESILYSIFWGALLGLLRVLLNKEFNTLISKMFVLFHTFRLTKESTVKIPYTVALLLGWLSYLSLKQLGRSLI